ncbi:MAG: hypothetical protein ACI9FR_001222 [Cryomorphaceae bacterium]|jgi:hypothetical protein
MMPIFFNLESHLWIAYLLVFNGFLVHLLIRRFSLSYYSLSLPFEAQMLASFFISIGINGALLLVCAWLGIALLEIFWVYVLVSIGLLSWVCNLARVNGIKEIAAGDFSLLRAFFYLLVFLVLFYNGGLIEQVADSWWHLSLAQKIAYSGSLDQSIGHLSGLSHRYYPPLWHGNLALISEFSGSSLTIVWNSVTAWVGPLKVMGFYLLSFGLSKDRSISLFAAVLFVLLPGVGDTYLRVSAWPSHSAYAAFFFALYASFNLFDQYKENAPPFITSCVALLRANIGQSIMILYLLVIMYYTHKAEVLWFAVALTAYFSALGLNNFFRAQTLSVESDFINDIARLTMILLLGLTIWFFIDHRGSSNTISDKSLAYGLMVLFAIALALVSFSRGLSSKFGKLAAILLVVTFCLLLASVNYTHLASLFYPELSLPRRSVHELPLLAPAWLGGQLIVPSWNLQLRQGFLYSGIVSLPVAILCAYLKPNRLTLFTAGTAFVVIVFCVSPYLYQWLSSVMQYHSSWRIAIILFHPIILAYAVISLIRYTRTKFQPQKSRVGFASLAICLSILTLVSMMLYDSRQHFDKGLIQLKRNHQSAQTNWNLFYDQRYVWTDSSLRYRQDISNIKELVESESVIFSDLPTSYYLAAAMPIYVRNIHRHQGMRDFPKWREFISSNLFCYLDQKESFSASEEFINVFEQGAGVSVRNRLDYIVINKDEANRPIRYSCMWHRRSVILENIERIAKLEFAGEYLNLYSLGDDK